MALSCLHPSSGERVQGQGQAVWFIKPALFKHVFVFKGLQKKSGMWPFSCGERAAQSVGCPEVRGEVRHVLLSNGLCEYEKHLSG